MENHYKNLLSPLRIGKYVIKNRMLATCALPHFLNGPEEWPGPEMINYYTQLAKSGPGIVTFMSHYGTQAGRSIPVEDICRFPIYDADNPAVDNYVCQITDLIRFYGALPATGYRPPEFPDYDVSDGVLTWDQHPEEMEYKAVTAEMLQENIRATEAYAKKSWANGFRMMSIPMGYECSLPSRFLSSVLNTRTDQYGGSLENRARYPLELCRAIKRVQPDMLVEVIVSGEMRGLSSSEVIQFLKLGEDSIDMVQVRGATCADSHPTCYNTVRGEYKTLEYAARIKASGVKMVVSPVGAFMNPVDCERFLAQGKCDMFGMGRAFICNSNFMQLLKEDRPDDVIPCVRCNKCHIYSLPGPYINACSVNPEHGIKSKLDMLVEPVGEPKRLAVIGGGPAGMQAAATAAKRGHHVTLYEKTGYLGGQLFHADHVSFKWPLADFRKYLIHQCQKHGVDIRMNTCISPGELKQQGFDVVIAALGATPKKLPIPGAADPRVLSPLDVFGHEDKLGPRVVLVGCAETGLETAMHIAEQGRDVTVLSRQETIAPDCDRIHYREYVLEKCEKLSDHLRFILQATTLSVDEGGVTYLDAVSGETKRVDGDTVIISGGMDSRAEEAMCYYDCAPDFYMIGDCSVTGNLQTAIRSGYAAASRI